VSLPETPFNTHTQDNSSSASSFSLVDRTVGAWNENYGAFNQYSCPPLPWFIIHPSPPSLTPSPP
jgi:hypothetical protein